ncbi:MAG: hypothetical protein M1833_007345 [Piccolia ochrophora]|nr:MAG: hypothetical protein M1833_007345 [Piccolia ochrophora]
MRTPDADNCQCLEASTFDLLFPVLTFENPPKPGHSFKYERHMASSLESQSDDTGSSLGDSTYEILSESDGEDHRNNTESIASLNDLSGDDGVSISGTDHSEDTPSTSAHADSADETSLDEALDVEASDQRASVSDIAGSGMTAVDEDVPSSPPIEFKEPKTLRADEIVVAHTMYNIDEDRSSEILKRLRVDIAPTRLAFTIRQTMAQQSLAIDEPLRILYIGSRTATFEDDKNVKDSIVWKISRALITPSWVGSDMPSDASRSPKFNVVPVNSNVNGEGDPDVELIASGAEIIVDECTSARTSKVNGSSDTLSLQLNADFWLDSTKTGAGFTVEASNTWKLPHMAIFFCSEDDSITTRQTRLHARSFVARHAVPSIMISRTPLYEGSSESYALDHQSVHLCLESRGSNAQGTQILKRLPIDLANFLLIDGLQMNRNLSCLTGLYAKNLRGQSNTRQRCDHVTSSATDVQDVEKMPGNSLGLAQSIYSLRERTGQEWRALLLLGALVFCAISGTLLTLGYQRLGQDPWTLQAIGQGQQAQGAATRTSSSFGAPSTLTSISSSPSAGSAHKARTTSASNSGMPKSLALIEPNLDLASLLLDPAFATLNQSDKFKMQIIGDCHIILRPPYRFTMLKKDPRLFVKVARRDQPLNVQLSKLFDGVYAAKLEREDAYGILNVTVWTKSKPLYDQTFQIDFGTPWLKVISWRRAAHVLSKQIQSDLKNVGNGVQRGIGHVSMDVQTILAQASTSASEAKQRARKLQQLSLHQTSNAKALVIIKAKQFSKRLASQRAEISKELSIQVSEISRKFVRKAETIVDATRRTEIVRQWADLPQLGDSARKTFTVARARKQAQRLWKRGSEIHQSSSCTISGKKHGRASKKRVGDNKRCGGS